MSQDPNTSHILSILLQLTNLLSSNPTLHAQITANTTTPILPASIPDELPINTSLPPSVTSTSATLSHLSSAILPYLNLSSLSPHYYGFVTGGTTPAALLADILASIYDQSLSQHLPLQTIATNVEVAALNMLLDLFYLDRVEWGLPDPTIPGSKLYGGAGTFTTGATASNVLGLALGRQWVLNRGTGMSVGEHGLVECMRVVDVPFVKILSTMPHSSIAKAAAIVGFGRTSVISIAGDEDPLKIDMAKLRDEVGKEGGRGRYIVTVSAGEVNTGRFATDSGEQMRELRGFCDEHGIWLHVDGAFGLFGRVLLQSKAGEAGEYAEIVKGVQGLELADSITGDGHKLLNVPYDCGFFFTRHRWLSEEVFQNGNAAYLSSGAGSGDGISNPSNIGIENSRRFRALPVYATLTHYGRAGYADMLKRQIGLARRVAGWIFDHSGYELLPVGQNRAKMLAQTLMIVLFRARDDTKSKNLVEGINASGKIYITGTSWDGRPAARIAVSNWQVDIERDSRRIFEVLETIVS
jgi:glutamate/tyrosine decarboxylase-like PLP-dependent enzyme